MAAAAATATALLGGSVSLSAAAFVVAATSAGVAWSVYAGAFPWVPDFSALTPAAYGTAPRLDVNVGAAAKDCGLFFTGYLTVPADGDYTFTLTTDTAALLRLHDATVIDADFGHQRGTEKAAKIRLQAGSHPFRLAYVHSGNVAPLLRLEWSGPGFARQPIADAAFAHLGTSKK